LIEMQAPRYSSLYYLLVASWIREPERQRKRTLTAAPLGLVGSNGGDTDRIKAAAEKDTRPFAVNRTRDCAIESCLKSLDGVALVARPTQLFGRNVPIAPDGELALMEIHPRSPRDTAHGLVIGLLEIGKAVSHMVRQSKPVQVTRYTGLRDESWARCRDQELSRGGRVKAGVNPEVIADEGYRANQPISYRIEKVSPQILRSLGAPSVKGTEDERCIVTVIRIGKPELSVQLGSVV